MGLRMEGVTPTGVTTGVVTAVRPTPGMGAEGSGTRTERVPLTTPHTLWRMDDFDARRTPRHGPRAADGHG
ncbi:hypothetical protein GCM10022285_53480 [Streptomyces tunisiensis]|uniref:Uncharacterized protein n=1 Tax=Streptomyces tunisiensis TaxID=948699 RepID=A0ABP7Z459_9ACTN